MVKNYLMPQIYCLQLFVKFYLSMHAKQIQQIENLGAIDKNKYSKVHTIKKLLDNSASASIVLRDILHKRDKILKDKKNK